MLGMTTDPLGALPGGVQDREINQSEDQGRVLGASVDLGDRSEVQ